MGKIIIIAAIAAAIWFFYNTNYAPRYTVQSTIQKEMNEAKDASQNALKKEVTFNKFNKNRELNQRMLDRAGQ